MTFSSDEFSNIFVSPNNGNLEKIKITDLPDHGTLQLDTSTVSLNQEISQSELANLKYIPETNYSGYTHFQLNGSDGNNYAESGVQINLLIQSINEDNSEDNEVTSFKVTSPIELETAINIQYPRQNTI